MMLKRKKIERPRKDLHDEEARIESNCQANGKGIQPLKKNKGFRREICCKLLEKGENICVAKAVLWNFCCIIG